MERCEALGKIGTAQSRRASGFDRILNFGRKHRRRGQSPQLPLCTPNRKGGKARDPRRHCERESHQFVGGNHMLDEAPGQRTVGGDRLGRGHHLHRQTQTGTGGDVAQSVSVVCQSDPARREREGTCRIRHKQVAPQREVRAAAPATAVDHGDNRRRAVADGMEQAHERPRRREGVDACAQRADVEASRPNGAGWRCPQDHDPGVAGSQ